MGRRTRLRIQRRRIRRPSRQRMGRRTQQPIQRRRTELHMRIVEAFRERDIELAFPQMDVWMRNEVRVSAPERVQASAPSAPATSDSKRD